MWMITKRRGSAPQGGRWRIAVLAGVMCSAEAAHAGEVVVTAAVGNVVVVIDGAVAGAAPLSRELAPGRHELAFRASDFGANLFTQTIEVPAEGDVDVAVDLGQMTASVRARPAATGAGGPSAVVAPTVAAPARPSADLYVATSEPGARIFIDGQAVEARSPTLVSGVTVGKHTVEARTDCARGKVDIKTEAQTIARAEIALTTGNGALLVSSEPAAAQVILDGKPVGVTPITLKDVSCGEHDIELRVLGYHPSTQSLRVPAFEVTSVKVAMEKERFGTLVVAPSPFEASISLDGVDLGAGPRTFEKVAAGEHTLRVALEGYDADERSVDIVPDVVTRLDVALRPTAIDTPAPPERAATTLPLGRIALNSGVALGGLALGGIAVLNYAQAAEAYEEWLATPRDGAAEAFWDAEVQPRKNAALFLGITGGAMLAGATALWVTTDWSVAAGPGAVELRGRW